MKVRGINKSKRLGAYSYRDANHKRDRDTYKQSADFGKIFQEELEKTEKHSDKNDTK